MNAFEFLVDPESFSSTVENFFHFAFLVKEGRACFAPGPDGKPMAEIREPPEGMMDGLICANSVVMVCVGRLILCVVVGRSTHPPFLSSPHPSPRLSLFTGPEGDLDASMRNQQYVLNINYSMFVQAVEEYGLKGKPSMVPHRESFDHFAPAVTTHLDDASDADGGDLAGSNDDDENPRTAKRRRRH